MEQQIIDFLQNIASEKGVDVERNTDLFAYNILDSIGIFKLLTYLDEELGIEFSTEDLQFNYFQSVDSILEWIGRKA